LKLDDTAEFLAHLEQSLDALELGLAVDIGEGADVQGAMQRRKRNRSTRVLDDPGCV